MAVNKLMNNLYKLYCEQKFAHAYLIETNDVDNSVNDTKELISKICNYDGCEENVDNLIKNDSFPGLIIVKPEGQSIKKDQIDALKKAFINKPIYSKNNYYIIVAPETMNSTAFNRMLKFLEEPENNIIGFLITSQKDSVANTIVSRCEVIRNYFENNSIEAFNELVDEYIRIIIKKDSSIMWYNYSVLLSNLTDRSMQIKFFEDFFNEISSKKEMPFQNSLKKEIVNCLEQLNYNVNFELLLSKFAIKLGEIYGEEII